MNHGHTTGSAAPAADADVMFATAMIDHHAQAIEMSDMILGNDGIDQEIIDLAEKIKAAQQPEIDQIQGWLDDRGADSSGRGAMDHGQGVMTDEDMHALAVATGADASRLSLEQMIEHHQGAITMAQDKLD